MLGSQLIWSLYFGISQFGPSHFQLTINLIFTINSLTKIKIVYWQIIYIADLFNIKIYNN